MIFWEGGPYAVCIRFIIFLEHKDPSSELIQCDNNHDKRPVIGHR